MKPDIVLTLQKYQKKVEITRYVSISCQIYKPSSSGKTRMRSKGNGKPK
jgi:hypothetical protein